MRTLVRAVIFAALSLQTSQVAADVRVISPGVISNSGLPEIAAAFTKSTGIKVIRVSRGMAQMLPSIKTENPPADVFMLPMELAGQLALEGGVKGSLIPLARVDIGLFKKPTAPYADISTTEKLANVLRGASVIFYEDPKTGSMEATMIGAMLARPEFAGVKGVPGGGNAETRLKNGEGDENAMGLGLLHGAHNPDNKPTDNPALMGQLPAELQMHIDMVTGVSARSTNDKEALAFIEFILKQDQRALWQSKGAYRY
jgi:ABC-type molybdate transport system substrate-binding protein